MARGGAIKQEDNEAGSAGEPKASKRRCVQSACVPCRKRKSKCDGGTPVCATCTAVYKTPCFYDQESENRRVKTTATAAATAGIKRDSSVVSTATNDSAEFLISSIRNLPESEVFELIQHIRKDARLDISALADSFRKTVTLPPSTPVEASSLERDLSMLLGKPAMTRSGESRYFGHTSGMSLVPEDENYTRSRMRASSVERKPRTWTTVTKDMAFVEKLLDLYFCWSHPFYVIFSRECFYKDFRSGRGKYCSSLLVNAILAYGCHFTDDPAGRTDPNNFRTAGDHFFDEARRLLYEDESPSLTTTQALCVMALREPSAGRDSSGFMYMGRCMRMTIELGLHLNNSAAPDMQLTPSEVEVRKVTFWGTFTVDTVWSICVGRISQLPRAAITLEKPILDEPASGLHPEQYQPATQISAGVLTTRMFLQEFSTLSELINDNNYMFFAPKERFTSRRLLDCYNKYQGWYKALPQSLRLDGAEQPQPHIIVLHMLYHTAIVHLFRPLLKVDIIHSDLRPRDACLDAANQVSELLRLYRQYYTMRACQLVLTHILLSVSIVHLLYSKESQISYRNLVEGLQGLEDISVCHYFGGRGFKIIYALSKVWNLPFPEELKGSKLVAKEAPADAMSPPAASILVPQATTHIERRLGAGVGFGPGPSPTQPARRESLSMFAQPERDGIPLPSHPVSRPATTPAGAVLASQPQHRGSNPNLYPLYPPSPSSTPSSVQQSNAPPSTTATGAAETLFWTPVPGMGVPILPRNYKMSPMDLDSMLGVSDEWERFSRDGFKMSNQWNQDPMNPYNGGGQSENYTQGPHETNGYITAGSATHYPGAGDMNQQVPQPTDGQTFDPAWWSGAGNAGAMS